MLFVGIRMGDSEQETLQPKLKDMGAAAQSGVMYWLSGLI